MTPTNDDPVTPITTTPTTNPVTPTSTAGASTGSTGVTVVLDDGGEDRLSTSGSNVLLDGNGGIDDEKPFIGGRMIAISASFPRINPSAHFLHTSRKGRAICKDINFGIDKNYLIATNYAADYRSI
jgi:hypothetical protein